MYFDAKSCGVRIKRLRELHNLTQEEVSKRLNLTDRYLRKIEKGNAGIGIDLIVEIALMFDVPVEYILLGKTDFSDSADQIRRLKAKFAAWLP